ncbi:MAG: hypothetical protein WCJ49_08260 [Deltaproteobacteria bacterium]
MEEEVKNLKPGDIHFQTQFEMKLVQFIKSDEPITPEIDVVRYSNQILMNITENEVILDFLELPGIAREGKMHVRGTRIYLTIGKTKKIHEVLGNLLKEVN